MPNAKVSEVPESRPLCRHHGQAESILQRGRHAARVVPGAPPSGNGFSRTRSAKNADALPLMHKQVTGPVHRRMYPRRSSAILDNRSRTAGYVPSFGHWCGGWTPVPWALKSARGMRVSSRPDHAAAPCSAYAIRTPTKRDTSPCARFFSASWQPPRSPARLPSPPRRRLRTTCPPTPTAPRRPRSSRLPRRRTSSTSGRRSRPATVRPSGRSTTPRPTRTATSPSRVRLSTTSATAPSRRSSSTPRLFRLSTA